MCDSWRVFLFATETIVISIVLNLLAHLSFAILGKCLQRILFALDIFGRRSCFQIWPRHPLCRLRGGRRISWPRCRRRCAAAQLPFFRSRHRVALFLYFRHQIAEALRPFKRARILVSAGRSARSWSGKEPLLMLGCWVRKVLMLLLIRVTRLTHPR